MAFRFQRRVKIAPGLTLNFSKRGLGLSAGVPGARVSIGPSGVHGHAGIPGTGIAYRRKLNSSAKAAPRRSAGNAGNAGNAGITPGQIHMMTITADPETGETRFALDDGGRQVTIGELRRAVPAAGTFIASALHEECRKRNEDLETMRTLHLGIPQPNAPDDTARTEFTLPAPALPQLQQPAFLEKIWPPLRRRREQMNEMKQLEHQQALRGWGLARDAFHQYAEAERQRRESVRQGDIQAMTHELEARFNLLVWPVETEVDFDLGSDPRTIALDVDLPPEDRFPAREWRVSANQLRLLVKDLSATARRGAYRDYVHSVALRMAGEVFAGLPTIDKVLLSGYTQVPDPRMGGLMDSYLFSVIIVRSKWREIRFDSFDSLQPAEAIERFELRRNMTSTGIFRPVEPFDLGHLGSVASTGSRQP